MKDNSNFFLGMCLVVLLRVFVSLLFLEYPESFFISDSGSYLEPALQIFLNGEFSNPLGEPETFRTPGFPLLLSLAFQLEIPVNIFVTILNAVFIGFIAFFAYKIAFSLFGSTLISRLSLVGVLLNPSFMLYQHLIMPEIFFVFLFCGSVFYYCQYVGDKKIMSALFSSLFLVASFYVKPVAIYLAFALPVALLLPTIAERSEKNINQGFVTFALTIALTIASISVWSNRNQVLSGNDEFASVQSFNLNQYISAPIKSWATGQSWESVRERFYEEYDSWPPEEKLSRSQSKFFEVLTQYPQYAVMLLIKGTLINMFEPGIGDWLKFFKFSEPGSGIIYRFQNLTTLDFFSYMHSNHALLLYGTSLGALLVSVMWALVFYGFMGARSITYIEWLMIFLVAYFLIVSAHAGAVGRFRLPPTPILIIFASRGFANLASRFRN